MSSISPGIMMFIAIFGVLQGILLSALIYFNSKSEKQVNIYLALHILFISVVMVTPIVFQMIGWQNSSLILAIPLLPGPMLYLYLRHFKETVNWKQTWPHFVIFFIVFFASLWNLSAFSDKYPLQKSVPKEVLFNPVVITLMAIRRLQPIIYYFLCRKTLFSYQRSVHHLFSETSRIDLNWARFLINGYLFFSVLLIANYLLVLLFFYQYNLWWLITIVLGTCYIYLATYKGMTQQTIWRCRPNLNKEIVEQQIHEVEEQRIDEQIIKRQTEKSRMPDSRAESIIVRITALMEKEKLFQEPDLTLQQLADKLGTPNYQVSQALNEGMKKNFYDVVNGYRVEEAKRLLLDSKSSNFTILSVGFEAGFNSKTTFNTIFKKFTGLTPSEYRSKNREVETV